MQLVDTMVFFIGAGVVLTTLFAAVRTVAVPRAERVLAVQLIFALSRRAFGVMAYFVRTPTRRHALWARFAPVTLLLLPFSWAVGVIVGFAAMMWSLGIRPATEAFVLAGSSFTTLGVETGEDLSVQLLEVAAALLGLGLIALLISYMPTIYGAFSRREVLVARLETRAGSPPTPEVWITRSHQIGWLSEMETTWSEWEQWFIEIEEAHTSHPALHFFRSPVDGRSWLTSAICVLDTAALLESTVDVPHAPRRALAIRAGFLSLRQMASFFDVPFDADPQHGDPVHVDRRDFDELCARLADQGVPVRHDRDAAWGDFAGWRVNYDALLGPLCELVDAPTASLLAP